MNQEKLKQGIFKPITLRTRKDAEIFVAVNSQQKIKELKQSHRQEIADIFKRLEEVFATDELSMSKGFWKISKKNYQEIKAEAMK